MAIDNHTGRYTSRLTPAAARVLEVASQLFYDRGIQAVGVDTIAAEAGVTKKTLYDRFRSKDNLIAAYLERRDHQYRDHVTSWVDRHPGVSPPLAVFDALAEWMAQRGPRGCAFVNAYAEIADPGHDVHRIARDHKAWLRDYLAELVLGVGHQDGQPVAGQLLVLHEGATVLYSVGADHDAAATARTVAAILLDRHRHEDTP